MAGLKIMPVKNGFVVDEDAFYREMGNVRDPNDTHVFNNPEALGAWVTKYYVDLEHTDEEAARREQQQQQRAEDHHE